MNGPLPIRVLKLGGSLLDQSGYATALDTWIDQQSPARTLVLVGGGQPVDAIRNLANINSYPNDLLHWISIDLMQASFQLVASQLTHWTLIESSGQLHQWNSVGSEQSVSARAIVSVQAFYDRNSRELPIGWETTSDSLAALLALKLDVDELVLIKSCTAPLPPLDLHQLAAQGIVDPAFPLFASKLKSVRIANLT